MKRKIARLMTMVMMVLTLAEAYIPVCAEGEKPLEESEQELPEGEEPFEDDAVSEEAGDAKYEVTDVSITPGSNAVNAIVTYGGAAPYGTYMIVSAVAGVGQNADEQGVTEVLAENETEHSPLFSYSYKTTADYKNRLSFNYGGFEPSTTYYFRLATKNNEKYEYCSGEYSFTTTAVVAGETRVGVIDFEIREIGFSGIDAKWKLSNPDNEIIIGKRLYYGDGEDDYIKNNISVYDVGGEIGYFYTRTIFGDKTEMTLSPAFLVYVNGQETWIKGDPVTIRPKEVKEENVLFDITVGVNSCAWNLGLYPDYNVDKNYYDDRKLFLQFCFKKEGDAEYGEPRNYNSSLYYDFNGLTEETKYYYFVNLYADSGRNRLLWHAGTADAPLEFTTGKDTVIDMTKAFPDPVFRKKILDMMHKTESDEIKLSSLQYYDQLDFKANKTDDAYITDITGIEYMINTSYLDLTGQNVRDISPIAGLKRIRTLYLGKNDITSLPDLSALKYIERIGGTTTNRMSLAGNLIPASEFDPAKFSIVITPEELSYSIANQEKPLAAVYAPEMKYYAIGDKHPFIVDFTGLKIGYRSYTVTAAIAGEEPVELTRKTADNAEYPFVCADMGAAASGEKEVTVTLSANDKPLFSETVTVSFEEDDAWLSQKTVVYGTKSLSMSLYLNGAVEKEDIESLTVSDEEGNAVPARTWDISVTSGTREDRYKPVFNILQYDRLGLTREYSILSTGFEFYTLPAEGEYRVACKLTGSEQLRDLGRIYVTKQPVIYGGYLTGSYDNFGDYIYLLVEGGNLSADTAPEIYYGGQKAAEFEECFGAIPGYGGSLQLIYKYKKLHKDVVWREDNKLTLKNDGSSVFLYGGLKKDELEFTIYPESSYSTVLNVYSDYRKAPGVLAVTFAGNKGCVEGATVGLEVWDSNNTNKLAGAEAVISGRMAFFSCLDEEGEAFAIGENVRYCLHFATDEAEFISYQNAVKYNPAGNEPKIKLSGEQYISVSENELEVRYFISDSVLEEEGDIQARFNGKTITLYHDETAAAEEEQGGKILKGKFVFDDPLDERKIQPSIDGFYYDDVPVIYNAGDRFTQISQEVSVPAADAEGCETVCVDIGLPRAVYERQSGISDENAVDYWNKKKLDVSFFTLDGSRIEATFADAEYTGTGLKAYYSVKGHYLQFRSKVTADGAILPLFASNRSYYESDANADEDTGKKHSISLLPDFQLIEEDADADGRSEYTGVRVSGMPVFPLTGKFMRPNTGEIISNVTIESYEYLFTETDIKELTDDEVYSFAINDSYGYSNMITGYFVKHGKAVAEETDKPDGSISDNESDKPGPDDGPDKTDPDKSDPDDKTVPDEHDKDTDNPSDTDTEQDPAVSMTLDKTELAMDMFGEAVLGVVFSPESAAQEVIWSSSDRSKVRVDENGKVKAWKPTRGVPVIITAVTKDGKYKAECAVSVSEKSFDDKDGQIRISPEDIDSYVIPEKVNKVFGSIEVNLGKKAGKVTVASMSVNYINAITYTGRAIKDPKAIDINFDASAVLKAAGISLKTEDILTVNYVFKNNKDASAGVTKDSKKSYFYVKLKINKEAAKLIGDKAKYAALKKIVAAVNKNLKTKENRCYFTINKAFFVDSDVSVYVKGGMVALNKNGALKGFKKVTVKLPGDTKEKKLPTSMFYKKEMVPNETANTVRVKGKKNFTGSVTVTVK